MKRIFISSLIAIVAMAMQARDFTYQDVTYTVLDENVRTCEIKQYGIPSSYSGPLDLPSNPKDSDGKTYTLVSIGKYAFLECSGLTSVTISNSITSIGDGAFYECSGLTSVTIPNSVSSIGNSAFSKCIGLMSVTIPNSVSSIGNSAFYSCSGLTSVTIPNSVTSIGDYAFSDCSGLTKAEFASIESLCEIKFGNIYANPLYYAHNLYINGKEIKNLVIPGSVTGIGRDAFSGCLSLTSVSIPNSVTSIGRDAFSGCSGLTSVTIPNSVTSIGEGAFDSCSGLTSVAISNSVTSIEGCAFRNCSGLTSVYYSATEPISGRETIFSDYDKPTLYVPAEAVVKCKTIYPWKKFSKIEAYDFSGIEPVHSDVYWSKPHEIYDINGVMVGSSTETLAPGIYIVRQGNAVNKIAVK